MTATELLTQVATRLWQVLEIARPSLPEELRERLDDGEMRWELSLMLAAWRLTDTREPRAAEVSQLVGELGASWVLRPINALRTLEGFPQFVDRARDADSDARLKAAAVSLLSATERLDRMQRRMLVALLGQQEVRQLGQTLLRRFPLPGAERMSGRILPPESACKRVSPGDRFDRADYALRARALRPFEPEPRQEPELEPEATRPLAAPQLDDQALTVAHLYALGYSLEQVQWLVAGPPKRDA